jgi:MFS family permease
VGGVLSGRITSRVGQAPALLSCLVVDGVVTIAMGLTSSAWAVAGLSILSGLFIVTWNVITVSLRQRIIPDHLFGRVNSVYRFIGWGSISIGAILGGILADAFGLRSTFFIGGAVVLVSLIPAWSRVTPAEIEAAEAR